MLMVYVAGPFSAPTREGVELNIRKAVAVGLDVAKIGAFPVIPHANTAHPDFEKLQPYTFWIDGTLELMRRCDAVLMVPGWESSKGATKERLEALAMFKPVFLDFGEFADWFKRMPSDRRSA
jgi:hypothetical protein